MAAYFLETSALVKRYVAEAGSPWVRGLCAPAAGNALFIAQIAGVEAVAAVALRGRRGATSLTDAATAISSIRRDFVRGYSAVPVTLAVIVQAMDLTQTHGLRGYDAVQLATALQVQAQRRSGGLLPLVFVCADAALNAAASAEGLAVDDPNAHP